MGKHPLNREKFKRIVHYVIWRAADRDGLGSVKLNKVLWFLDARAFMMRGSPITGTTYIREKYGPVPKHFMPIRQELEQERAIKVWTDRHFHQDITRMKAAREPDMSIFSKDEVDTINWLIKHIDSEHTAGSISEQWHDYAWEIAGIGEELPYHAIFANRIRYPNDEELKLANDKARALGLL